MEWLDEVLGRVSALHRGKDVRVSRDCREGAERAMRAGRLKEALALASQAVLRAPLTGNFIFNFKIIPTVDLFIFTLQENSTKSRRAHL